MLIRLEVDGFKNLLGFRASFGPFTCLLGPSGVGKSNVIDAIRLLGLLADHELTEAALLVRPDACADPAELFWSDGERRAQELRIAAAFLVPPVLIDAYGQEVRPTATLLQYVVRLGLQPPPRPGARSRIVLRAESLTHVPSAEAEALLAFPHTVSGFRREVVQGRRSGQAYISTAPLEGGDGVVRVHKDGGRTGTPRRATQPISQARRTTVAELGEPDTPTLYAARQTMRAWRALPLAADAIAVSWRVDEPREAPALDLLAGLGCVAGPPGREVTRRCKRVSARWRPEQSATCVRVTWSDAARALRLEGRDAWGTWRPARQLSTAALRTLTLAVLAEDPTSRGLLLIDDAAAGLDAARVPSLIRLAQRMVVDPTRAPARDNPLRQIITCSARPEVARALLPHPHDALVAQIERVPAPSGARFPALRCRPLRATWRSGEADPGVRLETVVPYLATPPRQQVDLLTMVRLND